MAKNQKTSMTPQARKLLLEALTRGAYRLAACASAGIPRRTFYDWMAQGQQAIEQGKGGKYARFVQRVGAAEAAAPIRALEVISKAMTKHWQAAAWFLERTMPHQYSLSPARFAREERERLEALGVEAQAEAATKESVEAMLLDIATRMSPEASRELLDAIRASKSQSAQASPFASAPPAGRVSSPGVSLRD